jgi:nicotinamide riboside transporter PnuC
MNWTYIITIASIIATVANIHKRRWSFAVWLVTNGIWCVYDISIREYSQAILWGVYALLAVWGLVKWGAKQ